MICDTYLGSLTNLTLEASTVNYLKVRVYDWNFEHYIRILHNDIIKIRFTLFLGIVVTCLTLVFL
jgi:hypothetical protein